MLELKWPPFGLAIMVVFGGVGVLAAITRANAGPLDWVPSVVAGVTAAVALGLLMARLPGRSQRAVTDTRNPDAAPEAPQPPAPPVERRTFLVWAVGAAAVGVLAAVGSSLARAGTAAVNVVRDALNLPAAATPAAAIPATAELGISGLAPVITPNDQFYRIDTALIVPQVDPADWSLRIHGMVANEVTITWDELLALPLEESVTTLACVSNDGRRRADRQRAVARLSDPRAARPSRARPRTPTWCCRARSTGSRRARRSRCSPTIATRSSRSA